MWVGWCARTPNDGSNRDARKEYTHATIQETHTRKETGVQIPIHGGDPHIQSVNGHARLEILRVKSLPILYVINPGCPDRLHISGRGAEGRFCCSFRSGAFPGICKFHGLPSSRDEVSGVDSRLALSGFLVLTFDFRGFRRSDGIFRLSREIEDAEHAVWGRIP
jgi:hypothetical protein